jgi:hypothetical protein
MKTIQMRFLELVQKVGSCFAIISGSKAMFVFAIYSYISIWLHYFATEKEDFKIIYGK